MLNTGVERMRDRDSGVVMKMCGGDLSCLCLSAGSVSPVLTATLIFGGRRPSASNRLDISPSGRSRFSLMSFARAFRGEM